MPAHWRNLRFSRTRNGSLKGSLSNPAWDELPSGRARNLPQLVWLALLLDDCGHTDQREAVEVDRRSAACSSCMEGVALFSRDRVDEDRLAVSDHGRDGGPQLVADADGHCTDEDATHTAQPSR